MSKRKQSICDLSPDIREIHDLHAAQNFLAPNEYSSAIIGIYSYLLRCGDDEQFVKLSQTGVKTEDFLTELDGKEKLLSNKCLLDIERCGMIARLRQCLKRNPTAFQNILNQTRDHLHQSMQEYPSPSSPKTIAEFSQQCGRRNDAALKLQQAYRMRRFQFQENNDTKQWLNIINLQTWILTHLQLFFIMITKLPDRTRLIPHIETLLKNSFIIIQHPSPAITTHTRRTITGATAKIHCRLLCLLDRSNPAITIDNITPFLRRLTTYYQSEEADTVYQQQPMSWDTYSILTASNTYKTFSCTDLSGVVLNPKSPTIKRHFAPVVYCVDFRIQITVRFPNDPTPYPFYITVQSAPVGLISHTSQEEDLFAKVFIEDLRSWKLTSTGHNTTVPPTTTNLTITEIVDSIRRYFIHKTGIFPKEWVMPYVEHVLTLACHNQPGPIENFCHNDLVKILAQINYMAKHPLLNLFHADGLFLSICDSDAVSQSLLNKSQSCEKSICAIRFGAMSRMSDLKELGIRIELAHKLSTNVQKYTFETTNLSMALGLYIIKIALCQASHFDSILTSLYRNNGEFDDNTFTNITTFVELYHSEKLLEICPHKDRYHSIWDIYYKDETTTTEGNVDNNDLPYHSWDSNPYTTDQTPSHYDQQFPSQPYHPQPQTQLHQASSMVLQYPMVPQINQTSINPPPIIIVVTNPNPYPMSNEELILLVTTQLPQYFQLIQSSSVYRIDTPQTSSQNSSASSNDLSDFLND